MAVTTRRGQLFVVGAILFGAIIIGTILLTQGGGVKPAGPEAPRFFFQWGLDEYPQAVNLAVAENRSARHIRHRTMSFLAFQEYVIERHGTTATAHTLLLVPNGTDVTAVVGNVRGTAMDDVRVTVDGTEKTITTLPDGESRRLAFTGTPDTFNASIAFTAESAFDHDISASRHRVTALYTLTVETADQTWTDTRVY